MARATRYSRVALYQAQNSAHDKHGSIAGTSQRNNPHFHPLTAIPEAHGTTRKMNERSNVQPMAVPPQKPEPMPTSAKHAIPEKAVKKRTAKKKAAKHSQPKQKMKKTAAPKKSVKKMTAKKNKKTTGKLTRKK